MCDIPSNAFLKKKTLPLIPLLSSERFNDSNDHDQLGSLLISSAASKFFFECNYFNETLSVNESVDDHEDAMGELKVDNLQEVADLMGHSVAIANKHYYRRRKTEIGASGGKTVRFSSYICSESPSGRKKLKKSKEVKIIKVFDFEQLTMSLLKETPPSISGPLTEARIIDCVEEARSKKINACDKILSNDKS